MTNEIMTETISKISEQNYLEFVLDLHKVLLRKDIILVYEGEVDQTITKAFTSLVERNLASSEESLMLKKRIYHVMVECLQNICKHSDNMLTGEAISPGEGVFIVAKNKDSYLIISGNAVYINRLQDLKETIDHINSLSMDELKDYYKQQLRASRLSDKGGAGLGLIDIAKKTGRKIEYLTETINEEVVFFILKLTIPKSV